ncbi:hypothetical protein [uncultured phage cr36_1]|uniref:Uncharacterized protein n=1 Tax=uncultured phage cr36_1 TaxID=2986397 RepID=A0AAE7RUA1_9CAUD|nr:hypothetical protein M1M47_gp13 [uncultured phage cr36_1]QWM89491.1 hypothetical protein [uncultured phage cr36_1]
MGTNTGLGIGIGIPFKNNALGGDKPYFPPELKARMIGVWTNYGKKNTDADRNIIKNKIPNAGGDLEILNAVYKLNSGFGEYSEDFTTWTKSSKITSVDSESFDFVTNVNWNLLYYKSNIGKDIPSFKVRIKLKGEGKVFYNYITSEGVYTTKAITSEEYVTPISYNTKYTGETPVNCGFSIGITSEEGSGTITQIPNFEDAFVTDGINDMIVSQKTLQEMGVTKELTIVSMIHQISYRNSASVPLTNYIRPNSNYVRSHVSNIGKTGIYGYVCYDISNSGAGNSHVVNTILGDKNDYSINIAGDLSQGKFSVQGYIDDNGNILETSSVAHYWTFAVLGKATEDEINLIIGNYNLDRSLKPDILCNIGKQGITNDNHAEFNDKLIDYSGNGRDIQMNNLAWKGGSGIAAKPYETFKDWLGDSSSTSIITQIDEFTRIVESTTNGYWVSRIRRDSDLDKVYDTITTYLYQDNNMLIHECKYKVDGIDYTIPIYENVGKGYHQLEIYSKDKYTELPENAENIVLSEWYYPKSTKGSIKYSVIPSYKGGILLDGISDFGKVIGMPVYKDYTIVADYERLNKNITNDIGSSSIISKSHASNQGAFLLNHWNNLGTLNHCYSFGEDNIVQIDDSNRKIYYQSKYSNQGISINSGNGIDSDSLWLGTIRDRDSRFFNGVIYSLMSFPYSMNKFLIERQLKKHKLGTLYPNMVEFRPVIKSSVELASKPTFVIRGTSTLLNTGDYIPENSEIWVVITMNNAADRITKFVINGNTIDIPSSAYNPSTMKYGFPFTIDSKSPQKITMTIEQDENYVKFEPVITSNVEYVRLDFYLNNYQKRINIGDYIPKDAYLRANLYLKNNVDELTVFTFNGVNIGYRRSSVDDTAFNINQIYNYDSPQEVNITVDEYIRYEDIVQPYPVVFQITDRNTNQRYSWGDKIKVGSSIQLTQGENPNLLSGLYSVQSYEYEGETYTYNQLKALVIIITKSGIQLSCNKVWTFDDNEPKCILSPRLLRIPNSSYKILGYIPDISGHGNHGVIHNSAYVEGSGVNEDGSYQFDGINDFVTIPTLSKGGKQVLMKVNWSTLNGFIYDQRPASGDKTFGIYTQGDVIAYSQHNNGNTYIDGIINNNIIGSNLSKITHNIVATCDVDNSITPSIGKRSYSNSYFAQMSLYDFMLFDEISTDDKIKELNTYIGITPKVTLPNYYWDNYGKKNTDAKRGYIDEQVSLQKTGTSVNPLENFNISYEGMSGYNGYLVVFGANKTWETSNAVDYIYDINSTIVHITNVKHAANGLLYSYVKRDEALANIKEIPAFRVTVKGLEENSKLIYKYLATENATKESIVYLGNGIHKLPKSFVPTDALLDLTTNSWIGFAITPMIEGELVFDCDITIEILPEYENGLVYDGVSDFTDNKNIPIFTDFTAIIKRVDLDAKNDNSTVMFKGNKIYESSIGNGFILDYCYNSKNYVYSYGKLNQIERDDSKIIYLTPESYNGNPIIKGENEDNLGLVLGKYWKGIIYKTILYSKTISLLEINFLKNLMEKDEIIDINHPIFISNTEDENNASQDT